MGFIGSGSQAKRYRGDRLRVEFNKLDELLSSMASPPQAALKHGHRPLTIIDEEFDGVPSIKYVTYYDGFQLALRAADVDLAAAIMRQAYQARSIAEGDHDEVVQ